MSERRDEIFCDECQRWSGTLDLCEHCGEGWPENVIFRGPAFDRAIIPATFKPVHQRPGDANS